MLRGGVFFTTVNILMHQEVTRLMAFLDSAGVHAKWMPG